MTANGWSGRGPAPSAREAGWGHTRGGRSTSSQLVTTHRSLRNHPMIPSSGCLPRSSPAAEITHMASEVRENRVVRNDKVFRDVPVGCDYAIHAQGLEGSLGAGTSRDPANEHDVAVRRVLDRLGAEVGNEVEQIDDALGILLRPSDRTRGVWPIAG